MDRHLNWSPCSATTDSLVWGKPISFPVFHLRNGDNTYLTELLRGLNEITYVKMHRKAYNAMFAVSFYYITRLWYPNHTFTSNQQRLVFMNPFSKWGTGCGKLSKRCWLCLQRAFNLEVKLRRHISLVTFSLCIWKSSLSSVRVGFLICKMQVVIHTLQKQIRQYTWSVELSTWHI